MTAAELRAEIKKGDVGGAYIFYGCEDYLKLHSLKEIRDLLLPDGVNDINYIRLDSENFSSEKLSSAIENLPCFAESKLIEVYDVNFGAMKESELKQISEILSSLDFYDYNTVVFFTRESELDAGRYRGKTFVPSKTLSILCEHAKPVSFETESEARLAAWLARHFAAEGIEAGPGECRLITELCGTDMYTLSGETAKLCAYLHRHGQDKLSSGTVYDVVIKNKEFGAFAFANAILASDFDAAYAVLDKLKERRERPEYILSSLSTAFSNMFLIKNLCDGGMTVKEAAAKLKMHEYTASLYARCAAKKSEKKLRKLFERCCEADLKMKSTPLDSEYILDRLVASTVGL